MSDITRPKVPFAPIVPLTVSIDSQGDASRPSRKTAIFRALKLKCPNCGNARLIPGYLKPIDKCPLCGEVYSHIRSDDAAPWLTILIVGHILVPVMIAVESADRWPQSFSIIFWPLIGFALGGIILPRAKALFIALIWHDRTQAPDNDRAA